MSVVDKVVNEWAFRCKKGYPDMNNPDDIKIFEQIFKVPLITLLNEIDNIGNSKKGFEYLSQEAQKVALEVASVLNIAKEFIKSETKTKIVYLLDMSRPDFFAAVEPLGFEQVSRNTATRDGISVVHKPLSAQIGGGHGKLNEKTFLGVIRSQIEQIGSPVTVNFTDGNRTYTIENIDGAEDASWSGHSSYSKSDVDLYSNSKPVLGVSIKKKVGGRWESSKTRFAELYKKFLTKAQAGSIDKLTLVNRPDTAKKSKYFMKDPNGKNWGKVVILNPPRDLDYEIIFGTETAYPTIVIEQDFLERDFSITGNTITVKVHKLYTNLKQIEEDNKLPALVFNHHIGVPNGIELRAFPQNALPSREGRSNTLYLSYADVLS